MHLPLVCQFSTWGGCWATLLPPGIDFPLLSIRTKILVTGRPYNQHITHSPLKLLISMKYNVCSGLWQCALQFWVHLLTPGTLIACPSDQLAQPRSPRLSVCQQQSSLCWGSPPEFLFLSKTSLTYFQQVIWVKQRTLLCQKYVEIKLFSLRNALETYNLYIQYKFNICCSRS